MNWLRAFCSIGLLVVAAAAPKGVHKITGGTAVDITDVPYIASVEFLAHFNCPAAIISPRWLASSALCMELAAAEDLVVRTGATNYEVGGHFWPVQSLKTHPAFRTNNAADLTLIEVALDIVENNSTKIIPVADTEPSVGTLARVSGWGSVADGEDMHRALLSVELPIYNRTLCSNFHEITDLSLCTLKDGAGPCEFDDGDPLVADGVLVGIKSWIYGEQCGDAERPSPYVNLANPIFRDFIRNVTGV